MCETQNSRSVKVLWFLDLPRLLRCIGGYWAGHGSRAVWCIHSLRSLGSRDRGLESHSGHGCLVFMCVRFSVFVYRYRPCDEMITRPRSPTVCLRLRKPKWNGEFHGGPIGGCSAIGIKRRILTFQTNILPLPSGLNYTGREIGCAITQVIRKAARSSVSPIWFHLSPTSRDQSHHFLVICLYNQSISLPTVLTLKMETACSTEISERISKTKNRFSVEWFQLRQLFAKFSFLMPNLNFSRFSDRQSGNEPLQHKFCHIFIYHCVWNRTGCFLLKAFTFVFFFYVVKLYSLSNLLKLYAYFSIFFSENEGKGSFETQA
jgi:hypothetical protein